jgi:hypothetical protein
MNQLSLELDRPWVVQYAARQDITFALAEQVLSEMPALLRQKIVDAMQVQVSGLLHDPIEDNPDFAKVIAEAKEEARLRVFEQGVSAGKVALAWVATKTILRETGIEWHTPQEMNPHMWLHPG